MTKKQELQQAKENFHYFTTKMCDFYEQNCFKLGDIMNARAEEYQSRIQWLESTEKIWNK
jgi:hypothetical protein